MTQESGTSSDFMSKLPAYSGVKFVATRHCHVPADLDPSKTQLPSPFVVVITGASRGIGRATAKAFAQAGASGLVLTARNVTSLDRTKAECEAVAQHSNLQITTLSADNAAESSALDVATALESDHNGQLHLLVNNAGILNVDGSGFGPILDMDPSNIEETMRTNYFGRFYMIKRLLPFLLSTTGAKSIVNISSIGGHINGPLGFSITALATNRLSQRVAEAYAEQGIFCCAIHPGAVLPEVWPEGLPEQFLQFSRDDPGLCGAFLIWLVKERREWLNGRYIDATWDVKQLEQRKDEIVEGDMLKMRMVV